MIVEPIQGQETLDVLVHGAGMMGSIGPGIWRQAGAEVVIVTGIDMNELDKYIENQRLRNLRLVGRIDEIDTILENHGDSFDIMNIAVPNYLHFIDTMKALKAEKDVLIEKPMTTNLEDADALLDYVKNENNPALAVQINSQYRYHELLNIALRNAIEEGKLGDHELGEVTGFKMGYLQGWQADPTGGIGWRGEMAVAGPGKLIADLGSHLLTTTYHLFGGGEFVDWEAQQYNIIPVRYNWLGAPGKTFARGEKRPSPQEAPQMWKKMDMLSAEYSGDDRAFAKFKFKMPNGKEIPGEYALSQVDLGNANGMYIQMDFEKASVIWDQEDPNHFQLKFRSGEEKRFERHSDPGLTGRPEGHGHGYGDSILIEIDELLSMIESDDEKKIRDYSVRNVTYSRNAVEKVGDWTSTELIKDPDSAQSGYISEHRKPILGR